jgi:hypothetical protein
MCASGQNGQSRGASYDEVGQHWSTGQQNEGLLQGEPWLSLLLLLFRAYHTWDKSNIHYKMLHLNSCFCNWLLQVLAMMAIVLEKLSHLLGKFPNPLRIQNTLHTELRRAAFREKK